MNLGGFVTEQRNHSTRNIDKVNTLEMIRLINDEDKKVAYAVENELEVISMAIDRITENILKGGRLIYLGAGTSGRLGILDAAECPPTFGVSPDLVQGIIAGGDRAILKAVEGAEDDYDLGKEDLKNIGFNSKDTLIGIAASGRTPYVLGGLDYANGLGALTISLTNNPNSQVSKLSQMSINPMVGPEVVTGSTRMKAGTSQKMVLNMISTGVMIKLGKIYGNLMVDVQTTNAKLIERAKNIIVEATGISKEEASNYLELSDNDVKLAILLVKTGLSRDMGLELLDRHNGYLAKAIEGNVENKGERE